jgi:hypothetical protein
MLDDRPQADRILIAQLHGAARHHARWRELTEDEHAAAVAEPRELAAGRADLLAHVAGILLGFGEGQLDEPFAKQAASLCRDAGADADAIGEWIEEGRRRAAVAGIAPFSRSAAKRPRPGRGGSLVDVASTRKAPGGASADASADQQPGRAASPR